MGFVGRAIIGSAISIIIGGVAFAWGVQPWIAKMVGDHPAVVVGIIMICAGGLGLLGVVAWVALGWEDKLLNRVSPCPRLGSLVYRDTIMRARSAKNGNILGDVELIVTLVNENGELVEQRATLRGSINGRPMLGNDGEPTSFLDGYATANGPLSITTLMEEVAYESADGIGRIDGTLDYDVVYWFPLRRRKRSTGRTIDFSLRFPVGELVSGPLRVRFRNLREA